MVLKILALHGYAQNGPMFRRKVRLKLFRQTPRSVSLFPDTGTQMQMGAIRKLCAPDCEFYFADAPMVLDLADLEGGNSTGSQQAALPSISDDPEVIPRAWWRANEDRTVYRGVEGSVAAFKEVVAKEGPFDGVLGFSQGAAFAALLTALLERPEAYPGFVAPQKPFKFGIFVSGFKPLDASLAPLFNSPIRTPTLHVLGETDLLVVRSRSDALVQVCEGPRVEVHGGGHFVPSSAPWRKFLKAYITAFEEGQEEGAWKQVASPSPTTTANM